MIVRMPVPLLLGIALAGCTAATQEQPTRTAEAEHQYQELVAGKVAQAPVSCLPYYNSNDMAIIDAHTIAFKVGTGRVYVNNMLGGCQPLGGTYTLLTKGYGTTGLCRGDIAQVVDLTNRITVGSCVFGDFIPYVKKGYKGY